MMAKTEEDRQRYVSVAVSFGDREALARHGSGVAKLTCPECGHAGERWGNPAEEHRFVGFTPVTAGGRGFILATCDKCVAEVTLPHAAG
jgi:hypothetical protein